MHYLSNKLHPQRKHLWSALAVIAVSLLVLLVTVQPNISPQASLITQAAAFTPIYQLDQRDQTLTGLVRLQRQLTMTPQQPVVAAKLAQQSLALYQASGNSRFLGMAKSALQPWWHIPHPDQAIWLLRGRIQQTEHQFAAAALDLTALNSRYPGSIEALLLEADAWRRAGQAKRSRRACLAVALAGRVDLARFCSAELLLSQGDVASASRLLSTTISSAEQLPLAQRNWAYAVYADTLVAAGELQQAAMVLAKVVASAASVQSYTLAYADVLLELRRWQAVVDLLAELPPSTATLLRQVKAGKQLQSADIAGLSDQLSSRMVLLEAGSDANVHLRERALYAWWVEENTEQALQLALQNWQLQKGWEDAELVLAIASQSNNQSALALIKQWRQQFASGVSV
jgi:hypothetical protein